MNQTPDADLPMADADVVGMSAERLSHIAPVMQNYIDKCLIPGAVTMVARHGKIVYFDAQGYKNIETQDPMQTDTVFRIASMTKPIVSLALMMLHEEGKFQLHDPIKKFLPAFADMKMMVEDGKGGHNIVPAKRDINVRHILTHTAGFASEYRDRMGGSRAMYFESADPYNRSGTIDDFVTRLANTPLIFEPGKEWDYSRATCVVGRLVEVLSGQTLKDFLQQRIFDPLEMTDTHFFLPPEKLPRFAASYTPEEDETIRLEDPDTADSMFASQDSAFYIGSGGLVSTASDYFRFAEMLRCMGVYKGQRLVSRKTLELMLQNHIGNKFVWLSGAGHGFGLGFGIMTDQGVSHSITSNGSYFWGGMYCTHWWNDPVEQLFGMVLTQVRPYEHLNIRSDMQTITTQAIVD